MDEKDERAQALDAAYQKRLNTPFDGTILRTDDERRHYQWGFEDGYAAASRWVSIAENGLPSEAMATYLSTKTGTVEEVWFYPDITTERYFRSRGVAWMPRVRPEPYQPKENT